MQDRVYDLAGRLPVMLYLPARLAWFRANRPQLAERVRCALSFSDWAVFRLTGRRLRALPFSPERIKKELA